MVDEIAKAGTPLARYIAQFYMRGPGADFMWDELAAAAWIDPSVITKRDVRYMAVDTDHSASYGNTLTCWKATKPKRQLQRVEINVDLDSEKFYKCSSTCMSAPNSTPLTRVAAVKGRKK